MKNAQRAYIGKNQLFVFAHQDDEYMILSKLTNEVKTNNRVICIFLTNGNNSGAHSGQRNLESLKVLQSVGVKNRDIIFCSTEIDDGNLFRNLHKAFYHIYNSTEAIDTIYCPAWEGGHHDHDAAHLIALSLAKKHKILSNTFQFPLYNGFGVPSPFFRTAFPLKCNGEVLTNNIKVCDAFKRTFACWRYRSQIKTWIGLFPFSFFRFFILKKEYLQHVHIERTRFRPHVGKLLYEKRYNIEFSLFMNNTFDFRKDYLYT